jgi:hypothetical protein
MKAAEVGEAFALISELKQVRLLIENVLRSIVPGDDPLWSLEVGQLAVNPIPQPIRTILSDTESRLVARLIALGVTELEVLP